MNPLTGEWVAKAEADYDGAVALNRRRKNPLPDLVCFHCQQCAEKYLKAILQERAVAFPKTHLLIELLKLVTGPLPSLSNLQPWLIILEDYAVRFRYPGITATKAQSATAVAAVKTVRRELRKALGIIPPLRRRN